jgi:hypothetical protein
MHNDFIQKASGDFLTNSLPDGWGDWRAEKVDKYITDNVWELYENHDSESLWELIKQHSYTLERQVLIKVTYADAEVIIYRTLEDFLDAMELQFDLMKFEIVTKEQS